MWNERRQINKTLGTGKKKYVQKEKNANSEWIKMTQKLQSNIKRNALWLHEQEQVEIILQQKNTRNICMKKEEIKTHKEKNTVKFMKKSSHYKF